MRDEKSEGEIVLENTSDLEAFGTTILPKRAIDFFHLSESREQGKKKVATCKGFIFPHSPKERHNFELQFAQLAGRRHIPHGDQSPICCLPLLEANRELCVP